MSLSEKKIHLRDGPFESDIEIVILHPSKGPHWVEYINENCLDSYVWALPQKLSNFIIKRIRYCLSSEHKIQSLTFKLDFYYASSCLCIIYLTKVSGLDFKSAVSKIYRQMIKKH